MEFLWVVAGARRGSQGLRAGVYSRDLEPIFFRTAAEWRAWLERHADGNTEVLVGFYKRGSGEASMTWPEAVDEALCFGWIDGVRRRMDEIAYQIRFTPRKAGSIWSAVNTRRVRELMEQGLVREAGRKAFEERQESRSGIYSFEQQSVAFEKGQEKQFRSHSKAWRFFSEQAPWYRRTATWWVVSAKREATKVERLRKLIEHSADERRLPHLSRE